MKVLFISFVVGLGVGIFVRSDPREESGATDRRLARPLGNGDRRTVRGFGFRRKKLDVSHAASVLPCR